MDSEYDRKFEEMKNYIPFLESMIKRLEMTSSVSNPRQAQLDKIRSLRDLLMDKKKRMKMENLLKCEQVLVNLYEKVEQRDSLPVIKKDGNALQKDKADLNTVRTKLKSAVIKLQSESIETLPEIARASETEEVCVPGSKEPALFQRRPNKSSMSPTRPALNKIEEPSPQLPKKNYTRILLSPEPNQNRWSSKEILTEKTLFCGRSPKKSPHQRSPSFHKKERKKLENIKLEPIESKDLNITLNVPQESLNSLNTKDILTRIINCSDGDVDIDTLRELRTQILGELKDTGANEDITDLILKSYKKKGKAKTEEIEEGELSDSESEAIESIYGSLVIMDKDKSINVSNKMSNEEPRKIKICLVINSDKNKSNSTNEEKAKVLPVVSYDFETFSCNYKIENDAASKDFGKNDTNVSTSNIKQVKSGEVVDRKIVVNIEKDIETEKKEIKAENDSEPETELVNSKVIDEPNFCKSVVEQNEDIKYVPENQSNSITTEKLSNKHNIVDTQENGKLSENSNPEIPLLEQTEKVSEIDILQALKKEILTETNNVLSSDAVTPALHQPKITKVGNAHEIGSKKRISIENYKAKTTTPLKNILSNDMSSNVHKDDLNRKQSLKLTEKECERFNFPSKLTLDESSDDEDMSLLSGNDIYENLAPKSPDHEDFADTGIKPPVIIPSDPVKPTIVNSDTDIDMRKIIPALESNLNSDVLNALSFCKENTMNSFNAEKDKFKNSDTLASPLFDPRMKKDGNPIVNPGSPNAYMINVDTTPRSAINCGNSISNINLLQNMNPSSSFATNSNTGINRNVMSPNISKNLTPNITPNMVSNLTPSMTPIRIQNVPNVTPTARAYDMTPSRQTVDNEDYSNKKKHVYAPMFPIVNTRDHTEKQQWDRMKNNRIPVWEEPRNNLAQRDTNYRDLRQRESEHIPAFEHYRDSPRNDRYNLEKMDQCHKIECPTTPNHPFGLIDCPNSPMPFGKMDIPITPIHPFGRSDCPSTPSHPFGRSECPSTPSHPFGRSDCPSTPSHPFGRPDSLLSMPFVRPDFKHHNIPNQSFGKPIDPRFKRSSDYDMYHNREEERDYYYFQDRNFNSNSFKPDHNNRNNNTDLFRRYRREKSLGRNERNNYDHRGRDYRESRRETSVGQYNRDYDNDTLYTRNNGSSNRSYDYRQQNEFKNYDKNERRSYKREKSVDRMTSRSLTRDFSLGQSFPKENNVSVQRHTGHHFTIDTSVNSTFQNKNHTFSSFDARRKRASSVGRTLGQSSNTYKVVNKESNLMFKNLKNKTRDPNFRRACSVGREIKDSKLDFKDIKEDLKSFKLKGESKWSREVPNKEESRKLTEVSKNCDAPNKKDIAKSQIKSNQGIKYSPRRNYRDPRMRRENSYEYKSAGDDSKSKSKDSKSYGIVYSNDNITKGTILGPGYGVKNYKIPKIKRPPETIVEKEINVNKLKENENTETENKISDDNSNLSKQIGNKNESDVKPNIKECKEELTNNQNNPKGSRFNSEKIDKVKVDITENPKVKDTQDIKQKNNDELVIDTCKNQEFKDQNSLNQVTNTSFDNVEKRITRSKSKSLSMDSSLEISPVKRIKRGKRSLAYETDSEDNDKEISNKTSNSALFNKDINNEKSDGDKQDNDDMTTEKDASNTKIISDPTCVKSKDKRTSSGIDSGFGIDDLEIFTDNTSEPVIDNIHALIADLDNDLDSSKPVDTESNFNRELTLEMMLENITSPESNDTKQDTFKELPVTMEMMLENITSPESNETKQDTFNELPETIETEPDTVISIKNMNDLKLNCEEELDSNFKTNNPIISKLQSDENNIKLDIKEDENNSQTNSDSKIVENVKFDNIIDTTKEQKIKNIEIEDEKSQAIVSTSVEGENQNTKVPLAEDTYDNKTIVQTKPDSTINSNVTLDSLDYQRSIPDSTNDINSEMNSVISSTHNIPDNIKQSNADSSSCNTPASKENISKLLSIKIKELLGLLGDQSSDNEKIKKKLEKLSEIVSDDEENTVEKEIIKENTDFEEEKSDETGVLSSLHKEEKVEIKNKSNNNTAVISLSAEDVKSLNSAKEDCTTKENKIVSEANEEIRYDTTAKETEINITLDNFKSNEMKEISFEPEVNINKVDEDDTLISKPTRVTNKKNKKGKKKTIDMVGESYEARRLTRSDAANLRFDKQPIVKKPSRELQKLQEDIREMFIRDDILSATGIRMCRIAKLVDESKNQNDESNNEISNQEPVVLLKKCNDSKVSEDIITTEKLPKKKKEKGKKKNDLNTFNTDNSKNKVWTVKVSSSSTTNIQTKSKDKNIDVDPYVFEADSINESKIESDTKNYNNRSESENESIYSSNSFGSTEILADIKKKVKRKRSKGWQAGIIKSKNKKKKVDRQPDSNCLIDDGGAETINKSLNPDNDCFTDKNYCFDKKLSSYECRLCSYNGTDIVFHYKKQHPHSEIPLSRMSPSVASDAIKESEKLNFQVFCKVSSKKYICRFCFKEFTGKKPLLETFFWHIVSMHTGEYKQLCSECLNVERCPFSLDIPPPPKEIKGQLLGYVCEKCNYTQISLENLKSHVIIRHNDEQTAVYTINLSVTAKGIIKNVLTNVDDIQNTDLENRIPRILRSTRSNQSIGEGSDVKSDSTDDCNQSPQIESDKSDIEKVTKISKIQSKITFENDNTDELSNFDDIESSTVKVEPELNEDINFDDFKLESEHASFDTAISTEKGVEFTESNDILNYPHFKIKYSSSGSKEYICCINGNDLHYRTTLLISFKKHVQLKHSENWDGFCFICKVIVTPQGVHLFKDCLQHFLDQHIDSFPVMEEISEDLPPYTESNVSEESISENVSAKSYLNVRPLSELISKTSTSQTAEESTPSLPVIESVISLGTGIEPPRPSPSYPTVHTKEIQKQFRYEEAQAEIMSRKHRVVLEAMMSSVKLAKIFKCAGRFCSFTTDSAEDALLHASTHTRVGGEDSLKCVYCDFDSSSNAIDLITHVFKTHGCCQYMCGMCFYRATASQLVNSHFMRVHAEVTKVTILHTAIQTAPIKDDNILPRNAAVPYYLCCASSGSEASCKFRTYTPGKFYEHLQIRHSSATEHSCFICSATLSTPAGLIRHLKTHGLKLYQCAWCVFGADNETEFLTHASTNHPNKQPKAYLRIITHKENTSDFRVLPLAQLNKYKIPTIEVAVSNFNENPVREAERSIELEKLIGHTTFMIESMTEVKTKPTETEITCTSTQQDDTHLENVGLSNEPQRMTTPPPQIIRTENTLQENQVTPILKTEIMDMTPEKNILSKSDVVYCLDSEDSDAGQSHIDLSNHKSSSNTEDNNQLILPNILPLNQLFLCRKCTNTFKCGSGFKKHITACYNKIPDPIPCAHCPLKVKKRDIVAHYTKTHSEIARCLFPCGECSYKFNTLEELREHEQNDHFAGRSNNNPLNRNNSPLRRRNKLTPTGKRKRSLEEKSETKKIPMTHLSKYEIPANEVTTSNFKGNSVREAKRSIELEKLSGQATCTTETKSQTNENEVTYTDKSPKVNEPPLENLSLSKEPQQRMTTPPLQTIDTKNNQENQLTPILKSEIVEMTPEKKLPSESTVYDLDSEEEDAGQSAIEPSHDESSSNTSTQDSNQSNQQSINVLPLTQLFLCGKCKITCKGGGGFKSHIMSCYSQIPDPITCAHCPMKLKKKNILSHYTKAHSEMARSLHPCSKCPIKFNTLAQVREHERSHSVNSSNNPVNADKAPVRTQYKPAPACKRKRSLGKDKALEPPEKLKRFGPNDVNLLPINPILDDSVFCSLCEFSTKVRLNMVRHLQLHAEQQIVSQTAPVNPVPHLETNEKHFDKMLNLASSSIVSRTPDKSKIDSNTTITLMIPPEAVSRYPKYVPERHRHTCGAKGCSYISVDESMFKCHWETLHSGTSDYRCVHCPPHQHLDTSLPLSAVRIIAHLKMHDAALYACSRCSYYHYRRQIVENHLHDIHKSIGQVMVVREEGVAPPATTCQAQVTAPTMDLKPWQCGLCKFRSLLCPEVVDHCAKVHHSKMQYKCAYCAFKTSNSENITKHQNKSHSDKKEEIFYYYYREGSVPETPDGTPLWQRQSQNCNDSKNIIKSEVTGDVPPTLPLSVPISKPPPIEVDLNLVKSEVLEPVEDTIENLCNDFGEFCEPNGLKYKCCLCKNVVEDSIDAMQSHLYEELKYRKWGCSICSYKAFHKAGLNDHMQTEHRQNKEPIALQPDKRVETWVAKVLEHQTQLIEKNKENLAKQKEEILRSAPGPSRSKSPPNGTPVSEVKEASNKPTMVELERLFGTLGASVNMLFCCPKCHTTFKDEEPMKNHLESELNKIRWICSNCSVKFQNYHEAQFHCRSAHQGQSARPVEVVRDSSIRSAWVEAVIRIQKLTMNYVPLPSNSSAKDTDYTDGKSDIPDNSLLVVRYEERVPTPEEQMIRKKSALNTDSDDDKLIIDEPIESRQEKATNNCPHCEYSTINARVSRAHVLRHYNLRPFTCSYCGLNGSKKDLEIHQKSFHSNQTIKLISTPIPTQSPLEFLQKQPGNLYDKPKVICLICQNAVPEDETATHVHDNITTSFGKKGDVVIKCSICLTLHKDISAYQDHHKSMHGKMSINYVFTKLTQASNEPKVTHCNTNRYEHKFPQSKGVKACIEVNHGSKRKFRIVPKCQPQEDIVVNLDEEDDIGTQRGNVSELPLSKKVAKKSTTKLPFKKPKPYARKSTTKLPFNIVSEPEEFSYYGTRPSTDDLDGVTTMMSFCNTMMPFTLKKLSAIININPVVKVDMLKQ